MPVLDKDAFYQSIIDGLARYFDSALITDISETAKRFPRPDLAYALNKNQMASKGWLVDELLAAAGPRLGTVYVVGGWYGILGALMLADPRADVARVLSIDIESDCLEVAEFLNRRHVASGRFRAVAADMIALDYGRARFSVRGPAGANETIEAAPDVIVNTSCEHLDPFESWYGRLPGGALVALQSNDMFDEAVHTNCVADLDAFRAQAPMSEELYAGELKLRRYTRFMLIGRK